MSLSKIWSLPSAIYRLTTLARINLGLNLNQRHKYLEVHDINTDERYTWDGSSWILTNIVASGVNNDSVIVEFVAQTNILAFQVVTSDGFLGDSAVTGQRNKIIGISNNNVLTGFTGNAITSGKILNPSWTWTVGDILYLNGTTISTTAPLTGYIQKIGTAIASNIINVDLSIAVLI